MRWSDEITLITEKSNNDVDDNGFNVPSVEETRIIIFGDKKSVGFSEFYKAQQAGYSTELKFDIFTEEYNGQTLAEYNGKRYKILRTYISPKTNGEFIELTLSDLSQRGDSMYG